MTRPLKFKLKDYHFISHKFPSYYDLLSSSATQHGDEIWVSFGTQEGYDNLLDQLCMELGDSLTDDGDLNEDGLRLEAAWDYADREGVPFGKK